MPQRILLYFLSSLSLKTNHLHPISSVHRTSDFWERDAFSKVFPKLGIEIIIGSNFIPPVIPPPSLRHEETYSWTSFWVNLSFSLSTIQTYASVTQNYYHSALFLELFCNRKKKIYQLFCIWAKLLKAFF